MIKGDLIDRYCEATYGEGVRIKEKVAELITPYLAKNNKIHDRFLHICIYDISDELNELVNQAPLNDDEQKLFEMIRICVSNEVKATWYIEPVKKEKKDKLCDDIDRALDINEDYRCEQYDPNNPYRD